MDEENKPTIEEQNSSVTLPEVPTSEPETNVTEATLTPQPEANPQMEITTVENPNKFHKFLKSWKGITVIAAVVISAILAFVFINKIQKEHKYEKNLAEFFIESSKASMAAGIICDDLKTVWQQYIFDDKEYFNTSTGTFAKSYNAYGGDYVYCSDFSEAVNKKIRWNQENLPSTITDPYYAAKRLYKEMTPAPGKYKDIHVYVKQMFKAMERLQELSINPTGNLSSYSSNCNQAAEDFTSALSDLTNETDIDLSKYNTEED